MRSNGSRVGYALAAVTSADEVHPNLQCFSKDNLLLAHSRHWGHSFLRYAARRNTAKWGTGCRSHRFRIMKCLEMNRLELAHVGTRWVRPGGPGSWDKTFAVCFRREGYLLQSFVLAQEATAWPAVPSMKLRGYRLQPQDKPGVNPSSGQV